MPAAASTTPRAPGRALARVSVAALLLHAAVPAACLDAFVDALPSGGRSQSIATLLAGHPHRSSALFAAGYHAQLPPAAARALLTRVPLTAAEAAHAVAVEATRTAPTARRSLLAEVLLTAGPQLSDATLDALTRAAGGTPITGDRTAREQHAATILDIAGVQHLSDRVRQLYVTELAYATGRLAAPQPGRPRIHVPVEQLTVGDGVTVGPWLRRRLGADSAAWAVLAAAVAPGATAADLADVVTAVLTPAAAGPDHAGRASRPNRTPRTGLFRRLMSLTGSR